MQNKQNGNKTMIILIGAILSSCVLVIACLVLLLISGVINTNQIFNTGPVKTATKDRMSIAQAYLSGMVNSVEERNYELYYTLTPHVTLQKNMVDDILVSEVYITNVRLSNYPQGSSYKVLAPNHINPYTESIDPYFNSEMSAYKYNFDALTDSKNKISYQITEGGFSQFLDDYSQDGDFLEFRVLVYNVGNYDYEGIMTRDKLFESVKYLQYANIPASQLTAELTCTLEVIYSNGERTFKDLVFEVNGQEFVDTAFVNYDARIDGATF